MEFFAQGTAEMSLQNLRKSAAKSKRSGVRRSTNCTLYSQMSKILHQDLMFKNAALPKCCQPLLRLPWATGPRSTRVVCVIKCHSKNEWRPAASIPTLPSCAFSGGNIELLLLVSKRQASPVCRSCSPQQTVGGHPFCGYPGIEVCPQHVS